MAVDHTRSIVNKEALAEQKSKNEDKLVEEICDTDIQQIGDMKLLQLEDQGKIISESELLDNTWDTLVDMQSVTQVVVDKDKDKIQKKKAEEEEMARAEQKAKDEEAHRKAVQEARDEILKP